MRLKHYFIKKIAHSSYLLAGRATCAVIDPERHVDIYIDEARALGVRITHILQTHLHADFVSGHMDLAQKTGARIYVAASAECAFDHVAVVEGDTIELEDMQLRVVETPGHTPEHVCYVVTDRSRGESPIAVFTGDALFVGDVGRPDLFPGRATELAGRLYRSLHDKLLRLPDHCEVYPAHGAGSLCGRSMGAKWRSTIGYERLYNGALQIKDEAAFVESLTANMPPAPDHFSRCSDINRGGPVQVSDLPELRELEPAAFYEQMEALDAEVLDVRSYMAYASMHIPDSWHLDPKGNLPTFAGWVLPTDKDILLVTDDYADAVTANRWVRRVGVDRIVGCLRGGMVAWVNAGLQTADIQLMSAEGLHDRVTGTANFVLVDVRAPLEFQDSHIQGAVNIPVADLRTRHQELDPQKPTIVICSAGNRSSLAASILEQHGFQEITSVAGGMSGYSVAGYARHCAVCENPHGSRYEPQYILAETS